jgi:negative regulator of sigma E activity
VVVVVVQVVERVLAAIEQGLRLYQPRLHTLSLLEREVLQAIQVLGRRGALEVIQFSATLHQTVGEEVVEIA